MCRLLAQVLSVVAPASVGLLMAFPGEGDPLWMWSETPTEDVILGMLCITDNQILSDGIVVSTEELMHTFNRDLTQRVAELDGESDSAKINVPITLENKPDGTFDLESFYCKALRSMALKLFTDGTQVIDDYMAGIQNVVQKFKGIRENGNDFVQLTELLWSRIDEETSANIPRYDKPYLWFMRLLRAVGAMKSSGAIYSWRTDRMKNTANIYKDLMRENIATKGLHDFTLALAVTRYPHWVMENLCYFRRDELEENYWSRKTEEYIQKFFRNLEDLPVHLGSTGLQWLAFDSIWENKESLDLAYAFWLCKTNGAKNYPELSNLLRWGIKNQNEWNLIPECGRKLIKGVLKYTFSRENQFKRVDSLVLPLNHDLELDFSRMLKLVFWLQHPKLYPQQNSFKTFQVAATKYIRLRRSTLSAPSLIYSQSALPSIHTLPTLLTLGQGSQGPPRTGQYIYSVAGNPPHPNDQDVEKLCDEMTEFVLFEKPEAEGTVQPQLSLTPGQVQPSNLLVNAAQCYNPHEFFVQGAVQPSNAHEFFVHQPRQNATNLANPHTYFSGCKPQQYTMNLRDQGAEQRRLGYSNPTNAAISNTMHLISGTPGIPTAPPQTGSPQWMESSRFTNY